MNLLFQLWGWFSTEWSGQFSTSMGERVLDNLQPRSLLSKYLYYSGTCDIAFTWECNILSILCVTHFFECLANLGSAIRSGVHHIFVAWLSHPGIYHNFVFFPVAFFSPGSICKWFERCLMFVWNKSHTHTKQQFTTWHAIVFTDWSLLILAVVKSALNQGTLSVWFSILLQVLVPKTSFHTIPCYINNGY